MSNFKITPKVYKVDGSSYKPGDNLILIGPERNDIMLVGLKGTQDKPITITADEKLLIKGIYPGQRVVLFSGCSFIRFVGLDGAPIEITGGGQAVDFRELSTNFEAAYLYIHHVGYSGINGKTDPTCDPKTWRGNFTLYNPWIHNCLIEDLTDGEGIYVGESHYHSTFPLSNCPSGAKTALEHDVIGAKIHDNIIRRVGADGIQLGANIKDGYIARNTVEKFGTRLVNGKPVFGQSSGIQANPGTVALIEDNIVDGGTSFGLIVQGRTGTIVRRNRVNNTAGGIMTVTRETSDKGTFQVYNNTFTEITGNGVESYSNTDFLNNVLQMKSGQWYKKFGGTLNTKNKAGIETNFEFLGNLEQLGLDASGIPTAASRIPAGVGWKDFVKPTPEPPKPTKEAGAVELVTENGIDTWYLTTPSGKRKKIE